ncbi:PREDICTED: acyl-lipid (8-3)-desaturase-like [Acropora digitifera]|uniref:acyl-lipid (8-3)-desaturase-like n=1 Tax=Acropora digitifera TaxID=70779 RepID=UPI00077A7A60|nr:PREDICTED: acyl-lipid (8-3)-desaturase-like [Acropora digitifera]
MSKKTQFTWEELSSLNEEHNAHVAVRGKVYDVSKFLNRHPGGKDMLLMGAGRDVTVVFETYHAFSDSATKVLEKYHVGELISNEFPTFPQLGLFFQTVRDRVKKHFKDTNQDPKYSIWMWFRYIAIPVVLLLMWSAQVFWWSHNVFLSCLAAGIMGWMCAMIGLVNNHDSRYKLLSMFFEGKIIDVHTLGHHPYTNIDGLDPDIVTTEEHPDIRRIKWTQQWVPRYVYQHVYIPLVYCLSVILDEGDAIVGMAFEEGFGELFGVEIMKDQHLWIELIGVGDMELNAWTMIFRRRQMDCFTLFLSPFVNHSLSLCSVVSFRVMFFVVVISGAIRLNPPSSSQLTVFVAGKLFFLVYRIVIPCLFLPVWRVVGLFIIADMVASYWLALCFQASHVVSEVDWIDPSKDGKMAQDWAELQIQTTQDYATDSWFFNVFTG